MTNAKYMQDKQIEQDTEYVLLKCDDMYLSFLLMPHKLYGALADLLIKEDVDYFWSLHYSIILPEQFIMLRDVLFKPFGKRVALTGTEYIFWLIGSVPAELLPYLKSLKG